MEAPKHGAADWACVWNGLPAPPTIMALHIVQYGQAHFHSLLLFLTQSFVYYAILRHLDASVVLH
jgi:hypothetical protein